eukprot:6621207-Alexandrium_andersonii.AAC.1
MAPVPVNIAVDSQAVVDRVQAFLDDPPQAMAILLQAGGKGASAIAKVKGHVTRAELSKYGMDEST